VASDCREGDEHLVRAAPVVGHRTGAARRLLAALPSSERSSIAVNACVVGTAASEQRRIVEALSASGIGSIATNACVVVDVGAPGASRRRVEALAASELRSIAVNACVANGVRRRRRIVEAQPSSGRDIIVSVLRRIFITDLALAAPAPPPHRGAAGGVVPLRHHRQRLRLGRRGAERCLVEARTASGLPSIPPTNVCDGFPDERSGV
jgi:hypothetical protein